MELAGHTCIGHCEKDPYAEKSYRAMFDIKESEWYANDVTKLSPADIPKADLWCFGFPCQDISIRGSRRGLAGERSGLYYSVLALVKGQKSQNKPKYLLIENVKNLLFIHDGWDFAAVLSELDEAGYHAVWFLADSQNFGVPQHRERVYIVANSGEKPAFQVLSVPGTDRKNFNAEAGPRAVYSVGRTRNHTNGRRIKKPEESMFTLTTKDEHGILQDNSIRKLTPLECFRLQGFPDEYFYRARAVNSDLQLYRQAGNTVTVPVLAAIGEELKRLETLQ